MAWGECSSGGLVLKSWQKALLAGLGAMAFLAPAAALPAAGVIAPTIFANEISPAGNAAFTDLTACLTSGKEKALDVFYLVDNSGSLRNTDASGIRFGVLENSISQLGAFADSDVTVRYSVGIFSTDASLLIDWTAIADSQGADTEGLRAKSLLESLRPDGKTDWEDGINFASQKLDESDSCRALIWFTDGAINPDDTDPSKFASLDALCQAGLSSGARDSSEYGLLARLKADRVSVFAVLLEDPSFDSKDRHFVSYLQPLVEGKGTLSPYDQAEAGPGSGEISCAPLGPDGLALPGQSNGALLRAEDPVALAYQFLKLETQLVGGSQSPIEDGTFQIGAGTVGFRIVALSGKWALRGPEGSGFSVDQASAQANGVTLEESATILSIDVPITTLEQLGDWTFESASPLTDLFVFSGLTLELDRDRESMVISGRDNTLTGKVARERLLRNVSADFPVDLSVYSRSDLFLEVIYDGALIPVSDVRIQLQDDGQFKIEGFRPDSNLGESIQVRLTLDVGSPFQPIRAEFVLMAVDAGVFPSLRNDVIQLSTLTGPEGAAVGLVEIMGPTSGEGGLFCFGAEPLRTDDPAKVGPESIDRSSQFIWEFQAAGAEEVNGETCLRLQAGETAAVNVIVTNPVQADSRVVSIREVSGTTQDSDVEFIENITFEFDTETQQNSSVTTLAIIILLLLGILIPLALLYLFNKLVTKFEWGEDVVRADFDVIISDSIPLIQLASPAGSPAGQIQVQPSTFMGTAPKGKFTSTSLGDLGELRAITPLMPLQSGWFEWVAPKGKRVVSSPASSFVSQNRYQKRFAEGQRAEVNSAVNQIWAVVVEEGQVGSKSSGPIQAKLVVFAKRALLDEYVQRVIKLSNKRSVLDALRSIASVVPPTTAQGIGKAGGIVTPPDGPALPPPPPGSFPPPPAQN
jgi:hypothetical protein